MIRRLFSWLRQREPKEPVSPDPVSPHPGRPCDRTCDVTDAAHGYGGVFTAEVRVPAVSHVDTARPATDLPAPADAEPTRQDCPQQTAPVEPEHVGATEEFGALLHAMRDQLDADVEHGVTALDPAEQAAQREEAAWEEAFARAEGAIDMAAARARRQLDAALDQVAPGWAGAICENHRCTLCAHTFDEAKTMAAAGAIALPAAAVDYGTAEYPVLVTA